MAYQKQTWDKNIWALGQDKMQDMLNHMEEGIANAGQGGGGGDITPTSVTTSSVTVPTFDSIVASGTTNNNSFWAVEPVTLQQALDKKTELPAYVANKYLKVKSNGTDLEWADAGGSATPDYIELDGWYSDGEWHDGGTLTDAQVTKLISSELSYIWMNNMHRLDFRYRDNPNNLATYSSNDGEKCHLIEVTLSDKTWRYKHTTLTVKIASDILTPHTITESDEYIPTLDSIGNLRQTNLLKVYSEFDAGSASRSTKIKLGKVLPDYLPQGNNNEVNFDSYGIKVTGDVISGMPSPWCRIKTVMSGDVTTLQQALDAKMSTPKFVSLSINDPTEGSWVLGGVLTLDEQEILQDSPDNYIKFNLNWNEYRLYYTDNNVTTLYYNAKTDTKNYCISVSIGSGEWQYKVTSVLSTTDPSFSGSLSLNRKEFSNVGDFSTALGNNCEAKEFCSFATGDNVTAGSVQQTVIGRYNVIDDTSTYAFIIGGGEDNEHRSSILKVDWAGHLTCSGVNATNSITIGNTTITEAQLQAMLAKCRIK